jgi:hypothetical protein
MLEPGRKRHPLSILVLCSVTIPNSKFLYPLFLQISKHHLASPLPWQNLMLLYDLQLSISQCRFLSTIQQWLYFNSRLFQYSYISTTIFTWEAEACFVILCCSNAWRLWSLCSACAPLPFLLSHSSISYNNPKNNISFVHIHSETAVHVNSVHKPLEYKIIRNKDALCSRWLVGA